MILNYPNRPVKGRKLRSELAEGLVDATFAKFKSITWFGATNELILEFDPDLSQGEQDEVTAIVTAHDELTDEPYFKMYDFIANASSESKFIEPYDVDFKTQLGITLAKKTLPKVQGKPTSVEYYEYIDENGVYQNMICKIDFTLTYDSGGFITKKQADLQWVKTDESLGRLKKNIGRDYDPVVDVEYRIEEGKMRRESIINGLQLPILGGLLETEATLQDETPEEKQTRMIVMGRGFLTKYHDEFTAFVQQSDKAIITAIENEVAPECAWLDNQVPSWGNMTIKTYVLSELNIVGSPV